MDNIPTPSITTETIIDANGGYIYTVITTVNVQQQTRAVLAAQLVNVQSQVATDQANVDALTKQLSDFDAAVAALQ